MSQGNFRHSCPNCHAKEKIIKKCKCCYAYTCSECSINTLCLDCYTNIYASKEEEIYYNDKVLSGIL